MVTAAPSWVGGGARDRVPRHLGSHLPAEGRLRHGPGLFPSPGLRPPSCPSTLGAILGALLEAAAGAGSLGPPRLTPALSLSPLSCSEMWSLGPHRAERAEPAAAPPGCNLTVKDLLLAGSGADAVSYPPTSRGLRAGRDGGVQGPDTPISESGGLSPRGALALTPGRSQGKLAGSGPEVTISWAVLRKKQLQVQSQAPPGGRTLANALNVSSSHSQQPRRLGL